jgi:hypothetical protein
VFEAVVPGAVVVRTKIELIMTRDAITLAEFVNSVSVLPEVTVAEPLCKVTVCAMIFP